MDTSVKVFLGLVGLILVANVLFLDIVLVENNRESLVERVGMVEERLTSLITRETQVTDEVVTGADREVDEKAEIEVAIETSAPRQTTTASTGIIKEVLIPLGSGSTSSTEWSDTGAQAYIDTTVYRNIEAAYFQASMRANSGRVFARLLQKNESAVVPGSEIEHNTPQSGFIGSGEILLSAGNKLYVVQVRSGNGQEAFVENARVRLVLK